MKRETLSLLARALQAADSARDLAAAIMLVEFGEPVAVPVELSAVKTPAQRARDYRKNKRDASRYTVTEKVTIVTDRHVTDPPLSSSPLPALSLVSEEITDKETEKREETRATVTAVTSVTSRDNVTVNASRDGAFAMLVSSWADGIRSVTRSNYPPPRGRAGGQLSATLREACTSAADSCEAARLLGAEYARANPGKTLTPFHFGDWLGSGKPERGSGLMRRGHELQPAPTTGAIWKEGT